MRIKLRDGITGRVLPRLHSEQLIDIATRYQNGEAVGSIAFSYDVSSQTVTRFLLVNGVELRKPLVKSLPKDEIKDLYEANHTQAEIAAKFGTTQKVIYKFMQRHGLKARVAVKRDQLGPKNTSWKGNSIGYATAHHRVEAAKGKPKVCEKCGLNDPKGRYEWANLTGRYLDINDYARLCKSCHMRMDVQRRKSMGVGSTITI